jgi:hypothetical protein
VTQISQGAERFRQTDPESQPIPDWSNQDEIESYASLDDGEDDEEFLSSDWD